jgi:hypothetical protein
MHEYLIERLSSSNLYHLQTLYKASFGKFVSLALLQKKYDTKTFGAEWIGYLALTHDRKPAAYYGIIPCHFKINGSIQLAAQSADTMTHPAHRQKGLFVALAKKTYALAQAENIQFVFGFPNQQSYPGFVKLGWEFLPRPMQFFILKGSAFPLAALCMKIPGIKSLYYKITEALLSHNTPMSISTDEIGVLRDEKFIRYKKGYSRTLHIRQHKAEGWIKNDGALKVGYIMIKHEISPVEMKDLLTSVAKKLGCGTIVLMTNENSQLYKIVSKISQPQPGLPIGFFNLTGTNLDLSNATFEYCDIDIF